MKFQLKKSYKRCLFQGYTYEECQPYPWKLTDRFLPQTICARGKEERYIDVKQHQVEDFHNNQVSFSTMNLSSVFEDDMTLFDPNYFVAGKLPNYADR